MSQPMCFVSIQKIKNFTQLSNKFRHNMRLREVPNADPEKLMDNELLIGDKHTTYNQMVRSAISEVESHGKKLRSDAVIAMEVMCTFPAEAVGKVDVEKWKEENMKWLKEYFGEENVVSAVLHRDEVVPHIHALVIPIDRDREVPGFNSKKWIGGRKQLVELQDSYAEKMEPLGLARGVRGSTARHQDIRQFYSALNNIIQQKLPEQEPGESPAHYYARLDKLREQREMRILKLEQALQRIERANETNAFYRKIAEEKLEALEIKLKQAEQKVKYMDTLIAALERNKEDPTMAEFAARVDEIVRGQKEWSRQQERERNAKRGRDKGMEEEKE